MSDRKGFPEVESGRWTHDGRHIVDDAGDLVGVARDPGDARRIVAAVNAVRGIPTEALEAWHVEIVETDPGAPHGIPSLDESVAALESYVNDRRIGERRRRERRQTGQNPPSPAHP